MKEEYWFLLNVLLGTADAVTDRLVASSVALHEQWKNIIQAHNSKILRPQKPIEEYPCNCRNKNECPLNGKCQIDNIVYKATVNSQLGEKAYIGLCSTTFKIRHSNHKSAQNNEEKRDATRLNEHLMELRDQNKTFNIAWEVLAKCKPYNGGLNRKCNLCLSEKVEIALHKHPAALLNSRSEFISKCRHQGKFSLSRVK